MIYDNNGNAHPWIVGIIALAIIVPLVVTALNNGGSPSSGHAGNAPGTGPPTSLTKNNLATVSGGSARLPEKILQQETTGIRIGHTAPVFSLPSATSSRQVASQGFYGRETLIDFFSTTCTACIEQAPVLSSLWHSTGSVLNMVGIDEGNSAAGIRSFAHRFRIGYPLALDTGAGAAIRYGVVALPTDVLLSPSGKVSDIHVGAISQHTLSQWLHATR